MRAKSPLLSIGSWPVGGPHAFPQPLEVHKLRLCPGVYGYDHRFTKCSPLPPVALGTNGERVHQLLSQGQFSKHSLFSRWILYLGSLLDADVPRKNISVGRHLVQTQREDPQASTEEGSKYGEVFVETLCIRTHKQRHKKGPELFSCSFYLMSTTQPSGLIDYLLLRLNVI
jgi:hypothetical protein